MYYNKMVDFPESFTHTIMESPAARSGFSHKKQLL